MRKPRAKKSTSIWVEKDHVRLPPADPAVIQYMKECEAREWIARFNKKVSEVGLLQTQAWWYDLKERMEKSRGKPAVDELVLLMKQEQRNARKSVQEKRVQSGADPVHAAGVQRSA
jgi:hypothetical protein